jgi:hypothetical protein
MHWQVEGFRVLQQLFLGKPLQELPTVPWRENDFRETIPEAVAQKEHVP